MSDTRPIISPIEKARIMTHEGHASRSKVKGLTVAELRAILARIAELEALTDPCPADCADGQVLFVNRPEWDQACDTCGGVGRVAKALTTHGVEVQAVTTSDGPALELKVNSAPVWSPFDGKTYLSCHAVSGSWEADNGVPS